MALVEIVGKINTGNKTDQTATVKLNFAFDAFDFKNVEFDDGGETFSNADSASLHAGANGFIGDGEYRDIVGGMFNVNKTSNDFGALLEEALLGDGVEGVTATIVGTDLVRFEIEGKGGSTDTINLTGEYVSTFLGAKGFGFGDATTSGVNIGNKVDQTAVRDLTDPNANGNVFLGAGGGQAGLENQADIGSNISTEVKQGGSDVENILKAFAIESGATMDTDPNEDITQAELDQLILDANAAIDNGTPLELNEGDGSFDFGDARLVEIYGDSFKIEIAGKDGSIDTVQIFDYVEGLGIL